MRSEVSPIIGRGAPPPGPNCPLPGMAMRVTPEGMPVIRLHWSADPEKTLEWAETQYRGYPDKAQWAQELEIEYGAKEGQRVYPEFSNAVHVIPDKDVPKVMTRYCSIDPHPRTPHAVLWVGIDKFSDWYFYRELWPSMVCGTPRLVKDTDEEESFTIRDYAETIASLEGNRIEWRHAETDDEYGIYRMNPGGEKIVYRFMDYAAKGFRASAEGTGNVETYADRYQRFGIDAQNPVKDHGTGEDAIHLLLMERKHDLKGKWPRLHVAASCVETILEFNRYKYPASKRFDPDKELKQSGVEARCHMLDNARYLATSNLAWIPSMAS